jgi:hypothetical protein
MKYRPLHLGWAFQQLELKAIFTYAMLSAILWALSHLIYSPWPIEKNPIYVASPKVAKANKHRQCKQSISEEEDRAFLLYLGQSKQSCLCRAAQGGQGKYSNDCRVLLSHTFLLTNFANVNDPLRWSVLFHSRSARTETRFAPVSTPLNLFYFTVAVAK